MEFQIAVLWMIGVGTVSFILGLVFGRFLPRDWSEMNPPRRGLDSLDVPAPKGTPAKKPENFNG